MKVQEIEVILSRHFAESLAIPIFITDMEGNLLFYNDEAEELLGKRYDETGPMPVEEWSVLFKPEDENGNSMHPQQLPLVKTLSNHKPAHGNFFISSLTGERHHISVTSFPLVGYGEKKLGAIAIFWKNEGQ